MIYVGGVKVAVGVGGGMGGGGVAGVSLGPRRPQLACGGMVVVRVRGVLGWRVGWGMGPYFVQGGPDPLSQWVLLASTQEGEADTGALSLSAQWLERFSHLPSPVLPGGHGSSRGILVE